MVTVDFSLRLSDPPVKVVYPTPLPTDHGAEVGQGVGVAAAGNLLDSELMAG
jgi:hypothetical protein